MKKETIQTTVNIYGINLLVEGYWEGAYYPATHEQPEEHPEFNITRITSDEDIQELLTTRQLESIYEKISK